MSKEHEWHEQDIPDLHVEIIPSTETEKRTPIDVINGALDELNRSEDSKKGPEVVRKPTIH